MTPVTLYKQTNTVILSLSERQLHTRRDSGVHARPSLTCLPSSGQLKLGATLCHPACVTVLAPVVQDPGHFEQTNTTCAVFFQVQLEATLRRHLFPSPKWQHPQPPHFFIFALPYTCTLHS